ncbi:FAD:protein FMN transferase [Jatrophihabitans telluris]|uniref:FAD:protein FMN transferase n=1 Tax=Jatrophihabitans telluris TaxID=2038343 RepID=A0ABY4QZQ6_9ACTN|nr:FAD:protein FMN transferase [Jatrophihabitans telluris]UQX88314.1 FAD:protein FMN transferase [Jatrophihabitans telluris]
MTASVISRVPQASLPTATWSDWSCLVRVVVTDAKALEPAVNDVRALMNRVERAASRFLTESEINWANINAGRPVAISRTMVHLMETALTEARRSDGALDPTVGRDLVRLGYDRDIHFVMDSSDEVAARPSLAMRAGRISATATTVDRRRTDWGDVRLDPFSGLLTVPPGVSLDLGASAKAQAADWAAADLRDRYGCSVLVEIGGDLAVAGTKRDWQVRVGERVDAPGQQVTLGAGGLATSTTTIRRWTRAGREVSHIVHPATGNPVSGRWRTATVAAESAVHANTCSTSALVLGDEALAWLAGQGVAARLIDREGSVVTIGGWPC